MSREGRDSEVAAADAPGGTGPTPGAVTVEAATIFRAGNRRYLTIRAARRGAPKQYLRQMFRAMGDDLAEVPGDQVYGWIEKLSEKLKRGQEMAFAEEWFEDPYGDPRTPAYGVGR